MAEGKRQDAEGKRQDGGHHCSRRSPLIGCMTLKQSRLRLTPLCLPPPLAHHSLFSATLMAFQKHILTSMPTEILREIAAALRTHDQTVFCRVSRLFKVVTVPVLYRHIHLDTVERTLACFHTLAQNPKRRTHVRTLRIDLSENPNLADQAGRLNQC
ncbi:hypothetical protein DFH09DRAFT_1079409 [Mycena vulgaris]|nr:hypothetical protein DFH09DRAFT_1079409 [Mycena vulgaris]